MPKLDEQLSSFSMQKTLRSDRECTPAEIHRCRKGWTIFLLTYAIMPVSMRRVASLHRQNIERKEIERQNWKRTVDLLRSSSSPDVSAITRETEVNRCTVRRICDAMNDESNEALQKLFSPAGFQSGRTRVQSPSEERMEVSRIKHAWERGFALDLDQVREAIAEMANNGRANYRNNLPSVESVQQFRAVHREITYRRFQKKSYQKFLQEISNTRNLKKRRLRVSNARTLPYLVTQMGSGIRKKHTLMMVAI